MSDAKRSAEMKNAFNALAVAAALLLAAAPVPAGAAALPTAAIAQRIGTVLPGFSGAAAAPAVGATRPAMSVQTVSGNDGSTLITEPGDGRQPVLDVINSAQQSITMTIYEVDDSQVVDALVAAAQRGVAVRVIYNHYSFTNKDPNAGAMAKLQAAGAQVKPASTDFAITHQKTLVADDRTAVIMTFNLRSNYFKGTRDFGYVTSDPGIVSEVENVFAADWNGTSYTPSNPALVWSPNNSRQKITDLIAGATRSLDIYNEELLDQNVLGAIEDAARRGVQVRVLCAALGRGTDANQPGRDALNAAGAQAKVLSGLYDHAKMVLADYGTTSARAYIGSENFSSTSLDRNRELGLIMTDSSQLGSLESTFQGDWNQ